MSFFSKMFARWTQKKKRSIVHRKLFLEQLEGRDVPSTFTWSVNTIQDNNSGNYTRDQNNNITGGAGSLRWRINQVDGQATGSTQTIVWSQQQPPIGTT